LIASPTSISSGKAIKSRSANHLLLLIQRDSSVVLLDRQAQQGQRR